MKINQMKKSINEEYGLNISVKHIYLAMLSPKYNVEYEFEDEKTIVIQEEQKTKIYNYLQQQEICVKDNLCQILDESPLETLTNKEVVKVFNRDNKDIGDRLEYTKSGKLKAKTTNGLVTNVIGLLYWKKFNEYLIVEPVEKAKKEDVEQELNNVLMEENKELLQNQSLLEEKVKELEKQLAIANKTIDLLKNELISLSPEIDITSIKELATKKVEMEAKDVEDVKVEIIEETETKSIEKKLTTKEGKMKKSKVIDTNVVEDVKREIIEEKLTTKEGKMKKLKVMDAEIVDAEIVEEVNNKTQKVVSEEILSEEERRASKEYADSFVENALNFNL